MKPHIKFYDAIKEMNYSYYKRQNEYKLHPNIEELWLTWINRHRQTRICYAFSTFATQILEERHHKPLINNRVAIEKNLHTISWAYYFRSIARMGFDWEKGNFIDELILIIAEDLI
jgi:hypothetical protein